MHKSTTAAQATIGFRVRTARAIAVLLSGSRESPRIISRQEISLWDPKVPESNQPYHAALDLSEEAGARVVRRARAAVQAVAHREVRELVEEVSRAGCGLRGVGLVVGSDQNPEKLGNAHIRAHALEGRLFREVLEEAAQTLGASTVVLVERDAYDKAARILGHSPEELKRIVTEFGKVVGRPWRSDERAAALAAWVALAASRS